MELRNLKYFGVVAEEMRFRRASDRLHVAQSAVSRRIQDLEVELGVQLLEGLSCVYPGKYGLFTMVEAVHQVRGTAGERQVAGAKLAIAHGNGGVLSSRATGIFGSAEVL